MAGELQPLDLQFPIVDAQGRPTQYFIRWAQQRQIDIGTALTLDDLGDYLAAHMLSAAAGSGIGLTPDGNLANSPAITAKVQEILDQISAVRGTVLYRGAAGWAGLAPGAAGLFLQTAGAGADPVWAAGGGGGSVPEYTTPSIIASTSSNASSVYVPSGATVPSAAPANAGNLSVTFTIAALSKVEIEFQGILNKSAGTIRLYVADNAGNRIWPNTLAGDLSNWSIGSRQSVAGFNGQQILGKGVAMMAAGTYTLVVWYDHVSAVGNVIWHDRMLKVRIVP